MAASDIMQGRLVVLFCLTTCCAAALGYAPGCSFRGEEHTEWFNNTKCIQKIGLIMEQGETLTMTVDENNTEVWAAVFELCDKHRYDFGKSWNAVTAIKRVVGSIFEDTKLGAKIGYKFGATLGFGSCFVKSMLDRTKCNDDDLSICKPIHGIDCDHGRDLPGAGATDDEVACCEECRQTEGCAAWSWNAHTNGSQGFCYLKKGCGTRTLSPNTISGISMDPMLRTRCKAWRALKDGVDCGVDGLWGGGVLGAGAGAVAGTARGTVEARQERHQIHVHFKPKHQYGCIFQMRNDHSDSEHKRWRSDDFCVTKTDALMEQGSTFTMTVDEHNAKVWSELVRLCDKHHYHFGKSWKAVTSVKRVVGRIVEDTEFGAKLGLAAGRTLGFGSCFVRSMLDVTNCHDDKADLCVPQRMVNCDTGENLPFTRVTADAGACCELCRATPECTAWTWNAHTEMYHHQCYLKRGCPSRSFDEHTISGVSAGSRVSKVCKFLMAGVAGVECGVKGLLVGGVLGPAAGVAMGTIRGTVEALEEKDRIRVFFKPGRRPESEMLI